MYRFLRGVMRFLVAVVLPGRVHVDGLENVPRQGGALLVGNHVGTIDPPLTGALIPRLDVHYMAKSEAFEKARVRWIFRGFNAFPVVRGSADRAALRHTLDLLRDGHIVLVYPEGSRSPDAHLRDPQAGVGFLARHGGVPVIPVAVWGTEQVIAPGRTRIHRAPVHVRYGRPVALPTSEGSARHDNRAIAAAIMDAISAMLPPRYRTAEQEAPASTPAA
ncbi:MAG: 1-acyl-sn-glycerol-3-phosphate acyltransferase [Candidatus Dormibacteraeota bacterium]|uniref:1-acyl-sn-glycerol-3-phosphate acyltransferase n=1 Tax=Candidatus Aeolococcus gillhamiae TaxID=3127015 RepID=A0A2W5YYU3_9BACT|nr:1-acyl-sn-glycerol-3-phosphate acyltransferase [Candidatus Dormibacteraeota bacterium]PZR78132.1 MAG: 1-acyl-sn-glycerol-3-phosphate acyltransferase [Candidatus Dormibacter sp. RRmetagenome_bin12]